MTKTELTQILAILRTNYPLFKTEDPKAMVEVWFMTLGEFSSEAVLESAKSHMMHSRFFPTPAELRENIVRHRIVLNPPKPKTLNAGQKAKVTAIPDGMSEEDFLDALIQDQIDLETEMEKNKGFLDYER